MLFFLRFQEGSVLKEHLEAKHTVGGVKCEICSIRLQFQHELVVHKARLHGGELPHKCPVCGVGKKSAVYLRDHMRLYHKDEVEDVPEFIPCDLCPLTFPSKGALKRHKDRDHNGITGKVTCEVCGKVMTAKYFEIHRKVHLGVKDHVCHVCGKGFNQGTPLRRHLEVHKKNGTWVEKKGTK